MRRLRPELTGPQAEIFFHLTGGAIEKPMTIRPLSRQEFDRFTSTQATLPDFTAGAVTWFADDTGLVLGAVIHRETAHPSIRCRPGA
jgi:hypothetical protein